MNNITLKTLGENPNLICPLGNYVVIDIMKAASETLGGVLLPDRVVEKDKQMVARVIAVGQGVRSLLTGEFMPLQVAVGDLIVLLRHAPVEVPLGGKTTHIIFEGDILGKVNEEELNKLMAEQPADEPVAAVDTNIETYQVDEGTEAKVEQTPSGLFVVTS